jgi:hypothetical protein
LDQKELEQTYLDFLDYDDTRFPRDFGLHSQSLESVEEYLTSLRLWGSKVDSYLSLYPYVWVDGKRVFTPDNKFAKLFFEVDAHFEMSLLDFLREYMFQYEYNEGSIEDYPIEDTVKEMIQGEILKDAKKKAIAVKDILDLVGIRYIILFSGNRSFHFHILLGKNPSPINNFGVAIREFFSSLSEYVDMQCVGEKTRVSRIVNTIHSSTGLYVVQVPDNDIANFTLDMAKSPREFHYNESNDWLPNILNLMGGEVKDSNVILQSDNESLLPHCVIDMIKNIIESGRASEDRITEHMSRVHLTCSLFKYGYSPKFTGKVFSLVDDFDQVKSSYQLQSIWGKLKPYSCRRLRQAGLCSQVLECPFEH